MFSHGHAHDNICMKCLHQDDEDNDLHNELSSCRANINVEILLHTCPFHCSDTDRFLYNTTFKSKIIHFNSMKMAKIKLKKLNIIDDGVYQIFKGHELVKYIKSFHGGFYNISNDLTRRRRKKK